MDDKIKALINIYTELKLSFVQISKSDKVDNKEKQELANLLKDLKERALNAGVDVENLKEGKIDNIEDWRELVAVSKIDYKLQIFLVKKIDSLKLNPSSTQMWEMIKVLDNFYDMGVTNAGNNLLDEHKKGDSSDNVLREFGQQAAIAAIQDNINALDAKLTLSNDQLKKDFAIYFSKEKEIPASAILEDGESSKDSWQAIVKESHSDERIKSALFTKIMKSKTSPDAKVILDLVNLLDEYYISNVSELKDATIEQRLKIDLSSLSDEQKHLKQEHYRKSAFAALLDAIEELDSNTWALNPEKDIHPIFVEYYDKKNSIPAVIADYSPPHQYKIDLGNIPFDTFRGGKKPIAIIFSNPTLQISTKFSFTKKPHAYKTSEENIFSSETFLKSFDQLMRNTVSLPSFGSGFKLGTTVYTNGLIIWKNEYLEVVLKTELGRINWLELVNKMKKKENGSILSLMPAIRLQFNWNLIVAKFDWLENLKKHIELHKVETTVSLGCDLKLEIAALEELIKRKIKEKQAKLAKEKAEKLAKEKAIDLADDLDEVQKLNKKADTLKQKAKDIKSLVDKHGPKKIPAAELKAKVDDFKKHATELVDDYKKRTWKHKAGKEAAEKVLEKVGKETLEIFGEKALKLVTNTALKAVPIIGQILLAIEVAESIYTIWKLIKNGKSNGNITWGRSYG